MRPVRRCADRNKHVLNHTRERDSYRKMVYNLREKQRWLLYFLFVFFFFSFFSQPFVYNYNNRSPIHFEARSNGGALDRRSNETFKLLKIFLFLLRHFDGYSTRLLREDTFLRVYGKGTRGRYTMIFRYYNLVLKIINRN